MLASHPSLILSHIPIPLLPTEISAGRVLLTWIKEIWWRQIKNDLRATKRLRSKTRIFPSWDNHSWRGRHSPLMVVVSYDWIRIVELWGNYMKEKNPGDFWSMEETVGSHFSLSLCFHSSYEVLRTGAGCALWLRNIFTPTGLRDQDDPREILN